MASANTYEELRENFEWELLSSFNIGVACSDRHPPAVTALIELAHHGERREVTFGELSELSNGLAVIPDHVVHPGLLGSWGCRDTQHQGDDPDEASR